MAVAVVSNDNSPEGGKNECQYGGENSLRREERRFALAGFRNGLVTPDPFAGGRGKNVRDRLHPRARKLGSDPGSCLSRSEHDRERGKQAQRVEAPWPPGRVHSDQSSPQS